MVFCKKCGAENSETANFCKSCGAELDMSCLQAHDQQALPGAGGAVCPNCGKPVQPGAKFCKSCGSRLDTDRAEQKPPKAGRTCPYCGKQIPRSVKFCKYCGATLSVPEHTGEAKTIPAAVQDPPAAEFVPEAALVQEPVSEKQPPVTEHNPVSPEEKEKKTMLVVIGVLGLLIVSLIILSAVLIPAKIREVQSAPALFDSEEWLEEDEDYYPPDDRPDEWIYHGGHDLPKWYYDQEG